MVDSESSTETALKSDMKRLQHNCASNGGTQISLLYLQGIRYVRQLRIQKRMSRDSKR